MSEHDDDLRRAGLATREAAVSDTFVMLSDSLVSDYDVVDVLDRLVGTCVSILGVHAAGMLLDDQAGGLAVIASSGEDARLVELFQVQHAEGPCRDCVRSGEAVASNDLERDADRWPRFVPVALDAGFRAVCALPLRLRGETLGALGLFSDQALAVGPDDQRLAQAFADVATIGILHHRTVHRSSRMAEQLRLALDSRVVIEQAKGVLAERHGTSVSGAFAELRKHARDTNARLTDVAAAVVRGELVLPPPERG